MPAPDPKGRFTDFGERFLLQAMLKGHPTSVPWFYCRLFTGPDPDPADDVSFGEDVVEATYDGYAIRSFEFDIPFLLSTAGDGSRKQYAAQSSTILRFMHTGDGDGDTVPTEDILGYYITSTYGGSGESAWINTDEPIYYRYFDAPVTFAAFMNPLYVLPAWKLFGEEDINCGGA